MQLKHLYTQEKELKSFVDGFFSKSDIIYAERARIETPCISSLSTLE